MRYRHETSLLWAWQEHQNSVTISYYWSSSATGQSFVPGNVSLGWSCSGKQWVGRNINITQLSCGSQAGHNPFQTRISKHHTGYVTSTRVTLTFFEQCVTNCLLLEAYQLFAHPEITHNISLRTPDLKGWLTSCVLPSDLQPVAGWFLSRMSRKYPDFPPLNLWPTFSPHWKRQFNGTQKQCNSHIFIKWNFDRLLYLIFFLNRTFKLNHLIFPWYYPESKILRHFPRFLDFPWKQTPWFHLDHSKNKTPV